MRKFFRRMTAFLVACSLCFCLLPNYHINAQDAAPVISEAEIFNRINKLNSLLGGKYFNVGQDTACGQKGYGHSCSNCFTMNIVTQDWFKELFGSVSTTQFPLTYSETGSGFRSGYSCYGFAAFAEWYIFAESPSDTVDTYRVGTYTFDYENVKKYARVGDLMRLDNSHSVIFIEASATGITVLDSNSAGAFNCMVSKHTVPYNHYGKMTISRVGQEVEPNQLPIGVLETVTGDINSVYVHGWAFDPDTTSKTVAIYVYVGGPAGSGKAYKIRANMEREDVHRVYRSGKHHGFESTILVEERGTQDVYVYAVDLNDTTKKTLLGYKTVTIKTGTEPTDGTVAMNYGNTDVTLSKTYYVYTGTVRKPVPTVICDGEVLEQGVDYKVTYSNHVNAGTATVTITGKGKYVGHCTANYTISPRSLIEAEAALTETEFVCDGNAKTPLPVLSYNGTELSDGTDYTVEYTKNTGIGEATVTVTGQGNYSGTCTLSFIIKPDRPSIASISNASTGIKVKWNQVEGANGYYIYRKDGTSQTYRQIAQVASPTADSYIDTTAVNGTQYAYRVQAYKSKYRGQHSQGKSKLCVSTPVLTKYKNVETNRIALVWEPNSEASGYEIQYSVNSDMTEAKTIYMSGADSTSKAIAGLVHGQTYYIRVKAYATVDGKTTSSGWSGKKSVYISR